MLGVYTYDTHTEVASNDSSKQQTQIRMQLNTYINITCYLTGKWHEQPLKTLVIIYITLTSRVLDICLRLRFLAGEAGKKEGAPRFFSSIAGSLCCIHPFSSTVSHHGSD